MEAGSRKYIEVKVLYPATRITNWFTFLEIRLDKLKVWTVFTTETHQKKHLSHSNPLK